MWIDETFALTGLDVLAQAGDVPIHHRLHQLPYRLVEGGGVVHGRHQRGVRAVSVHHVAQRAAEVLSLGVAAQRPPIPGRAFHLGLDFGEPGSEQVALVLEVHVEGRAGQPRVGHQPLHADLGVALATGQQPLDHRQQPIADLLTPLRPAALAAARHRRHQAADAISCGSVAGAMAGQTVRSSCVPFSLSGGVAQVRLSRPGANNAINDEMVHGLAAAVDELGASAARAAVICGDGAHFTVGGDLDHLAGVDELSDELAGIVPVYHDVLMRLAGLDIPVVCAAQGVVAGGGLGLLWCADAVIAASDLRLTAGFAGLGLSGDGGSSWALPRMVGERRARQLLLLGRQLDAQEALGWGLVDQVVDPERLHADARAEAARLAAGPTVAFARIKRLLRSSPERTLAEQLDAERAAMVACAGTEDAREGILSFTQRRRPE